MPDHVDGSITDWLGVLLSFTAILIGLVIARQVWSQAQ